MFLKSFSVKTLGLFKMMKDPVLVSCGLAWTGWLILRTYISRSPGDQESKIKVLALFVPGESPLPSSWTAVFSLYPHVAEREKALFSLLFLTMTVILSQRPYPHDLMQSHHLPKVLPLNTIMWGLGLQHINFGGTQIRA